MERVTGVAAFSGLKWFAFSWNLFWGSNKKDVICLWTDSHRFFVCLFLCLHMLFIQDLPLKYLRRCFCILACNKTLTFLQTFCHFLISDNAMGTAVNCANGNPSGIKWWPYLVDSSWRAASTNCRDGKISYKTKKVTALYKSPYTWYIVTLLGRM